MMSSPALAGQGDASVPSGQQKALEIPLEGILTCKQDERFKFWTLKAEDGRNIQVAIVCQNGRLTAHFPHSGEVSPPTDAGK